MTHKSNSVNPFILRRQFMDKINKLSKSQKRAFAQDLFNLLDKYAMEAK